MGPAPTLAAFPPQEKQTRFYDKPLGQAGWRLFVDQIRGAQAKVKFAPQMVIEGAGAAINDDPSNIFRFEQSIGADGLSPYPTMAAVEALVPELAKSLGKPIVSPEQMGEEPA